MFARRFTSENRHIASIRQSIWKPLAISGAVAALALATASAQDKVPELQVQHGTHFTPSVISPDGKWYADAFRSVVTIWDADTGMALRNLHIGPDWVEVIAVSPSGSRLAVASRSEVYLFNVVEGTLLCRLSVDEWEAGSVPVLSFGRDDRITVFSDLIAVYDATTGDVLSERPIPSGWTTRAASRDGRRGIWASKQGFYLGPSSLCCSLALKQAQYLPVSSVVISPDGALAALALPRKQPPGTEETEIEICDLRTPQRKLLRSIIAPGKVDNSFFSDDSQLIATEGQDHSISLFQARSGQPVQNFSPSVLGNIHHLGIHGTELIVWSQDENVKRFDLGDRHLIATHDSIELGGRSIGFMPDKQNFYVAGHYFHVWNILDGELRLEIDPGTPDEGEDNEGWSVTANDEIIFQNKEVLKVFDRYGAELRRIEAFVLAETNDLSTLVETPDSSRYRDIDKGGALVDIKSPSGTIHLTRGICDAVLDLELSHNGKLLACGGGGFGGSQDYLVLVSTESGARKKIPISSGLMSLIFSDDDSTLFVGTDGLHGHSGAQIYRINLETLEVSKSEFSPGGLKGISISPDGKTLVSAGWDNFARKWDAETLQEQPGAMEHADWVDEAVFSTDGKVIATRAWDNVTRFWSGSGQYIGSLMLYANHRWVFVSSDGYFDGTSDGWDKALWRFGGNTFNVAPVEIFFNEFFLPGVLGDVLQGKHRETTNNIRTKDRRQPHLDLLFAQNAASENDKTAERQITVRIRATEAPADSQYPEKSSGVRDVRLFRNGVLVGVRNEDLTLDGKGGVTLDFPVTLISGENRLSAYAFNHENIKSQDATLTVTSTAPARPGVAYILVAGLNQYANPDYNLRYAAADAEAFARELSESQRKLKTFARIVTVKLLDQTATRSNLLWAIDRLAGRAQVPLPASAPAEFEKLETAQPEDAVFIYFAGHGTALNNRFYLIPYDLGYQGNWTALTEDGLKAILQHSVSDLDLENSLTSLDAGRIVLIVDACNSGQALEAEEKRRGPMNSKGLAQLAYEKGMYILAAAQSYEDAREESRFGHGLLTYALVEEGIKTTVADTSPKDGQVELREWLDYAVQRVPLLQDGQISQRRRVEIVETTQNSAQVPRVFYRKEPEMHPFVVAAF